MITSLIVFLFDVTRKIYLHQGLKMDNLCGVETNYICVIKMKIDNDTVKKVARLARLKIPEDKLPVLASQLSNIMDWIEQLQSVNVAGVEPMAGVNIESMPFFPDEISDGDKAEAILQNAPEKQYDMFMVPKVVE